MILLADDAEYFRTIVRDLVAERGYGRLIETSLGKEALSLYCRNRFRIVLLDVVLPDVSGLHVLQAMKAMDPHSNIVVVTAAASREVVRAAKEAGAAGVLGKPVEVQRLSQTIADALARRER